MSDLTFREIIGAINRNRREVADIQLEIDGKQELLDHARARLADANAALTAWRGNHTLDDAIADLLRDTEKYKDVG